MGDVLRILVRFKITGHGIVYTVKITPFADDICKNKQSYARKQKFTEAYKARNIKKN